MITDRTDVAARFSRLRPRADADPTLRRTDEFGASVGHYLHGHDLKVQADLFRVTDPTTARPARQVRVQMQLFF
jgi:hypothetical protein